MSKPNKKLAVRLRTLATGLNPKIEHKRTTMRDVPLTYRRQRMIKSANQDADHMENMQALMYILADLQETGMVPESLTLIKSKVAVDHLVDMAEYEARQENGKRTFSMGSNSAKYFRTPFDYKAGVVWAMEKLEAAKDPEKDRLLEIDRLVAEAELSRPPGYFCTPPAVYELMFTHVSWEFPTWKPIRVLEPEAGSGALADGIVKNWPEAKIDCIEIVHKLRKILELKGYKLVGDDFLEFEAEEPYDVILMNPPFEKGQDRIHVQHAYKQLAPAGILVSVMSPGPFFRKNNADSDFRAWFTGVWGDKYKLPDNSFKTNGTSISSVYVVIQKPV